MASHYSDGVPLHITEELADEQHLAVTVSRGGHIKPMEGTLLYTDMEFIFFPIPGKYLLTISNKFVY